MGHVTHKVVVVTSWNDHLLDMCRDCAIHLGLHITEKILSSVNGYQTFLVGPSGSSDGWTEQITYDGKLKQFIDFLDQERHADGSTSIEWAVFEYGNDPERNDDYPHSPIHAWSKQEERYKRGEAFERDINID